MPQSADPSSELALDGRHRRLLLALAAASSLFADTPYVPVISVLQPTLLLAYCNSCQREDEGRRRRCQYLTGWFVLSLFRAVPARDYFLSDDTLAGQLVAYGTAFAFVAVISSFNFLAGAFFCWAVWGGGGDDSDAIATLAGGECEGSEVQRLNESTPRGGNDENEDELEANSGPHECDGATITDSDQPPSSQITTAVPAPDWDNSKNKTMATIYKSSSTTLLSLTFPILMTSLYQLIFRFSPIGATGNPAMGLSQVFGLRQTASLFGEIFLVFWLCWMAVVIVGVGFILGVGGWVDRGLDWTLGRVSSRCCGFCCGREAGDDAPRVVVPTRSVISSSHVASFALVTFLMYVYGGVRELAGRGMYWQSIELWPTTQASEAPLRVSCLTRNDNLDTMIGRTNERLAAGDDLILWSEAAGSSIVTPDLFNWDAAKSVGNEGAVVAPTFYDASKGALEYNVVEMMQGGSVIARYEKNRPVPVMEPGVAAGSERPKPTGVTFRPAIARSPAYYPDYLEEDGSEAVESNRQDLSISTAMAICFDFDFPDLFRKAHTADLAFGPSWYWASIGYSFWKHNTFRAIENGFSLIKCAEEGISGAVDPYGRTLVALPTLMDEVHVMEVPVQPGVATVFGSWGWVFGWLCVGLSPIVIALGALSRKRSGGRSCNLSRPRDGYEDVECS